MVAHRKTQRGKRDRRVTLLMSRPWYVRELARRAGLSNAAALLLRDMAGVAPDDYGWRRIRQALMARAWRARTPRQVRRLIGELIAAGYIERRLAPRQQTEAGEWESIGTNAYRLTLPEPLNTNSPHKRTMQSPERIITGRTFTSGSVPLRGDGYAAGPSPHGDYPPASASRAEIDAILATRRRSRARY